jgi:hypothetical protein
MSFSRRDFAKYSGLAALASMFPSLGRAGEPGSPPLRVLFIYSVGAWTTPATIMRPPWAPPEWSTYNPWDPDHAGMQDLEEWEFDLGDPRLSESDFSRVLQPLYRHRAKATVLEGLAMLSTAWDEYGDGHAKGHIGSMCASASTLIEGIRSQSVTPSIDQRINEFLRLTDRTHFSLDFKPTSERRVEDVLHAFLYKSNGSGGTDRLPTESNPEIAFSRIFGGMTSTPDPREIHRRSVLSLVQSQYSALEPHMSGADRVKLEQHRGMIADLQAQLSAVRMCGDEAPPASVAGLDRGAMWEADWRSFADLITASFACNVSRVASLGLGAPPELYGLSPGASIHHEYEHPSNPFKLLYEYDGNMDTVITEEDGRGHTYREVVDAMVARNAYQMAKVAEVIDRLDSVPEGGGTLLDHTIVVYVSELSHGSHGHEHWPVFLFGGGATGVVRPGRYIKYPQANPNPYDRNYANNYSGTPHSHLYVSLCRAFGMDIDYIHQPSVEGTFPMRRTISMTGPLPRLA